MNRRVTIIGFVLLTLFVVGLIFTYLPKARRNANLVTSQNNLRQLAIFGAHHVKPDPKRDASRVPSAVPAGTIVVPGVPNGPPEDRLSWVVTVMPLMDQQKNPVLELFPQIDQLRPWAFEANQQAGRTRLPALLCPEHTPDMPAGEPAITCYVGIGGVGLDAASLPVGAPRAGAFRYDGTTPFDRITDGLSQTLLFAETRNDVGPWLRGGPSTVRGLNDASDAQPLIGGQFGGYFEAGGNFAMCDGGVRTFSPRTTPSVLLGLATIAGKESDRLPGE